MYYYCNTTIIKLRLNLHLMRQIKHYLQLKTGDKKQLIIS